jgi:lipopolysaccharide export LptBFGC system permease protein LptF
MYPDNNPTPIDYLNQIAPQQQKPGLSKRSLFIVVFGIGAILALVVGMLLFINGRSSGPTADLQTLTIRMQAMQTIADSSQKNIKSSALRGINSNLKILLTNANRDIVAPLAKNNIDIKKLDKTLIAKEKTDTLSADLEEARLNGNYDDTYAREMSFQLTTLAILMEDIHTQTKSASTKEFLEATDKNLQPIKKQLDEFNSTVR